MISIEERERRERGMTGPAPSYASNFPLEADPTQKPTGVDTIEFLSVTGDAR